jgi:hypothetical protein
VAANTVTSTTGVAAAVTTDTVFSVTFKPKTERVWIYVKYTKGANNLTLTFKTINSKLSTTDEYGLFYVTDDDTTAARTVSLTASGNSRFEVEINSNEKLLVIATFAGTGGTDIAVINIDEG